MRYVTLALVVAAFVVYVLTFGREGIGAILFFFPFTMIPFLVSGFLAYRWRTLVGQIMLLAATFAYAVWFVFVYVDVMYLHPDAQSAIAFLFVGIYAAPVLLVFWLLGWGLDRWRRKA